MIRKISVELAFPGESSWTDVSSLVLDKSWTIDRQAFNDEKKSAVDKFACNLKFDQIILSKLRAAEARILIRVKDIDGNPLFFGAIEPAVSHETSDHIGDIAIEAADNSWRLDEKIKTSRQMPASVSDAGFYIWNPEDQQHSICHILLTEAGYATTEIDHSISALAQIAMVSVEAEASTYREVLDTLLMEHELVLHAKPDGILTLLSWRPTTITSIIDKNSLSTAKPFRFENRFDKRDGAKVTWAQPEIIPNVLVYRENLPVDENGVFTGEAIAAGDYYPKDSDIEDIYQSYVENWLDRPYLARETRIKNKDLTLLATSEPQLSYDADDGITPDIAEFDFKRAHIRFINNAIETKKIYNFEIKANVLIRKKIGTTKASPLGTETDILEYTSQYIFDDAAASALAQALAFDALAEEQYSFGLNEIIDIGSRVRLIEQRNGTDVEAIIRRVKLSGKSPVNEYEAIQYLFDGNLQLNNDYSISNPIWPPINIQNIIQTLDNVSRVFYNQPTVPYSKGDLWIRDNALFVATVDKPTGEFSELDWEWCIRSNITTVIESTNGTIFKPGQSMTTILRPRCFRNGMEITDILPDSAFRWTRTSFYPQPAPNDDATWNQNHAAGYRTIEVTAASIYARATYTVDIIE